MKLEGHIYCEGPDCENHTHVSTVAMEQGRLPHFIKVIEYGHRDEEMAFCCWDCLMKYAAAFDPPRVVPFDGPEDFGLGS